MLSKGYPSASAHKKIQGHDLSGKQPLQKGSWTQGRCHHEEGLSWPGPWELNSLTGTGLPEYSVYEPSAMEPTIQLPSINATLLAGASGFDGDPQNRAAGTLLKKESSYPQGASADSHCPTLKRP
ncbi:hypothetical protein PtA15_9A312 [Puccinia triticina]|uniref:Uncharacterized protein n=1 Tax=Puccinia triticina TaxID=208348 RepID=A0ABY7CW35_9BASI|nr:uncharacterized protein PtA15_9A312 [Puccinia triticina]WAQ88187.1 hypothetical protein PtA15_9A312 [Puccinia triticina]WAR60375.1 hypothetical protein PtB15_9B314 [Puccinia triticina]